MHKQKWLFPKYNEGKIGDSIKVSTTVRFKRDGIWYEIEVWKKFLRHEEAIRDMDLTKATGKEVGEVLEMAYLVQKLYIVSDQQTVGKADKSPIQFSEKDRLKLIKDMQLHGLENLI